MKLWSFQYESAYKQLIETGKYNVDSKTIDKYFAIHYRWLAKQMEKRIGPPPAGVEFPIWAWARRCGIDGRRPDLRHKEYGCQGDKLVLLEIEVPDSQVVLSDSTGWDFVLNNNYFDPNNNTDKLWDAAENRLKQMLPEEREKKVKESWEKIFEIVPYDSNDTFYARGKYVQATFWTLDMSMVKSAKHFVAR